MAIEDRNLEPGTKLIAKYKKEEYKAEVIAGREDHVPAGRRKRVQESLIGGHRHHQQGLQRLGLLERRGRRRPQRSGGARGRRIGRNGDWGANAHRWVPASAKSKGRRGRRSETLLRRLPEEFHGAGGRTCRAVSRRAHIEWGARGNHRSLSAGSNNFICLRQVSQWSLPFALLHLTTNWSTSRGNHR